MITTRPLFIPVILGTARECRLSEHVACIAADLCKVQYPMCFQAYQISVGGYVDADNKHRAKLPEKSMNIAVSRQDNTFING